MTLVTLTNLDDIRIEVVGDGRATTISACRVLAILEIFRWMFIEEDWDFSLFDSIDDETNEKMWECTAGDCHGAGPSPWDAIENLALECRR